MKAVILAGGEGTRLRPLTSNQPKPMMPIANVPMMEHIVRLLARARLRRHRRDGCVPREPHPQLLRRRLRLRRAHAVRDRGVAARHRRVRCATRWTSSTRRSSSSPATCSPTSTSSALVEAHRNAASAFASIALKRVENPVEFGIVITRDDGTIERFLEKPTWGEVFSDTINTGIYVLEPERVRATSPRARSSTSRATCSRRSSTTGGKLYGHVARRLLGGRRHARGVPHRPRGHPRRPGRRSSCPGFQVRDGVWLGENADVSPDVVVEGPVLIGDNCRIEAGAVLRPYTVLGDDVVVKADAQRRAQRRARPRLHRAGRRACAARCSAARATSATACASKRASSSATSRFIGARRDHQPVGEDLPVQVGRPGRARHVVDRVGEPRRAHAVRAARCARPRQRRHHLGGRGAARDGVRHRAQEGLGRVHEPRHEPRRRGRSSGRSSRA